MGSSAGVIEFYKLAAGVIPVLWVGNVLQRLDPSIYERTISESRQALSELNEWVALTKPDPAALKMVAAEQARQRRRQQDALTRARRASRLAVIALPVAAVSEAISLWGVATNQSPLPLTLVVAAGLLLGGTLLLLPLWSGALRVARDDLPRATMTEQGQESQGGHIAPPDP